MAAVEACLPDGDRLRGKVVAGLFIGFAGILVLVWPDLKVGGSANRGFLTGVIALQIARFRLVPRFGVFAAPRPLRQRARHDGVIRCSPAG